MKFHCKTIGILGGIGPSASAHAYMRMVQYAQYEYCAVQDSDYPPIILYSLPLTDFDETGIVRADSVKKQLISGVKKLEQAGCDLIIITCNTVHIFYEELQEAVSIPLLNIVEETAKRVVAGGYKKVGLFASESTVKSELYQKKFSWRGLEVLPITRYQQDVFNQVIKHVMGGNQKQDDIIALKSVAAEFTRQGAEAIVLGCTEIPLAINQTHTDVKLFDTMEIIVQSAVDYAIEWVEPQA